MVVACAGAGGSMGTSAYSGKCGFYGPDWGGGGVRSPRILREQRREVIVELHCKASCLEEFAKDFIGVFFSDLYAQLLI